MKPIGSILMLFLLTLEVEILRAQTVVAAARASVLIVLRQPEGPVGQRLAATPLAVAVPDEVRAVAEQERTSLNKAQAEAFDGRLAKAGATSVVHYAGLNMVRAEIPLAMVGSVESDPAVLSLTPLSGDTLNVADTEPIAVPAATARVGVQPPAGAAIGKPGRKPDAIQSPLFMAVGTPPSAGVPGDVPVQLPGAVPPGPPVGLMPGTFQSGIAAGQNPAFMPMPSMPMSGMPGTLPGTMPGSPLMGQPAGFPMGMGQQPGSGGMFQSLMGVTSQMGAQGGMAVPRASGVMLLVAGGAQVAQILAASHKQACSITLDKTIAHISPAGGTGTLLVRGSQSCLWLAQSDAEWLKIETDGPMAGPGLVRFSIAAGEANRTGVITIAGITKMTIKGKASLTVTQGH